MHARYQPPWRACMEWTATRLHDVVVQPVVKGELDGAATQATQGDTAQDWPR